MLEIGSVIDGKYKILSVIGEGGMSVVYLAINEKANKPWAIKEIRRDDAGNYEIVRQGLIAETETLKRLRHANLPSIIDVIEVEDTFLIVMDYIEGNPLSVALRDHGAQEQDDVVKWAKQLCGVYGYLHSRTPPIIYRDMKPGNIMLQPDGNVKLIDFGTAREFKVGRVDDTVALGTQGYAAPEQYGVHQTDARTDIYNLGATMYHLLTGHNPCEPPYVMYPICSWNPALSSGLEAVVRKCTQRDPSKRYQNAAELLYDLEHFHDLESEHLRAQRIKMRLFLLSICFLLLSVIGMVGFAVAGHTQRSNSYNTVIARAQAAYGVGISETADNYVNAARIDPTRPEAYNGLLTYIKQDQAINAGEDELLRRLLNENNGQTETNIERFKKGNPSAYADFAYDMGIAYFFIFEGGVDAGQKKARTWLADAAQSSALDQRKKDTAEKLSFIAEHYENVFKGSGGLPDLLASDAYEPEQYWEDLVWLLSKEAFSNTWSSYIALNVYGYAAGAIYLHCSAFLDAGVSAEALNSELMNIEQALSRMEPSDDAEKKRVEDILDTVERAQVNVRSAYEHTVQMPQEEG
jgi:serine/threonine-protein kinase